MSKTITIPRGNTIAIKVVRALQDEKKRLKEHLSKGEKLDQFEFKTFADLSTK